MAIKGLWRSIGLAPALAPETSTVDGERWLAMWKRVGSGATEDLLYAFYPLASRSLSQRFSALREQGRQQLEVLSKIAQDAGVDIDPTWVPDDTRVEEATWEPVARSSTRALLDLILDTVPECTQFTATAEEWARRAGERLLPPSFTAKTGIDEASILPALTAVASTFVSWDILGAPTTLVYGDDYLTLVASPPGGPIRATWSSTPTLVFLAAQTAARVQVTGLAAMHQGQTLNYVVHGGSVDMQSVMTRSALSKKGNAAFVTMAGPGHEHLGITLEFAEPTRVKGRGGKQLTVTAPQDEIHFGATRPLRESQFGHGTLLHAAADAVHA